MQQVIDGIKNYLYQYETFLTGYVPNKNYVLKFSKKDCTTFYFKATTKICECRVEFLFTIEPCLKRNGEWLVEVLEDNVSRTFVDKFSVIVNNQN